MAFPTPEPEGIKPNEDFKAHNFSDLDSLMSELSIEKETVGQGATPPNQAAAPGQPVPGQAFTAGYPGEIPSPQISREEAERAGKRMATLVDSMLATGGMMIAKAEDSDKYKATEGELTDLGEAWSDVTEEYNFKVNPWFNIAILTLMVYTPKILQANNDRRLNKMESDIKELQANQRKMELVKDKLASNE